MIAIAKIKADNKSRLIQEGLSCRFNRRLISPCIRRHHTVFMASPVQDRRLLTGNRDIRRRLIKIRILGPLERMMRVMMMINDVCSGDDFSHRLLLSVQNVLKEPVLAYKPIKEGKWKIFLPSGPWFLKEFSSETKWKQQQALIRSLHSVHFFKTAEPHPMQTEEVISFQKRFYGVFRWIESSIPPFSYKREEERIQALSVLNEFHACTETFYSSFLSVISQFDQTKKWKGRHHEFEANRKKLEWYLSLNTIKKYLWMGERAIEAISKFTIQDEMAIIHGDVAHHNFIKDRSNRLFITDFDLIAIAPKTYDYIQFAMRVLPILHWDESLLWKHPFLDKYQDDPFFLAHLLFPSDIFREWNRFFKRPRNGHLPYLYQITVKEMDERTAFFNKIFAKMFK